MIDPISLRITMQHVRGFLCSPRVAIINRNSPAASRLIVRLLVTVIRKKRACYSISLFNFIATQIILLVIKQLSIRNKNVLLREFRHFCILLSGYL